MKGIFCLTVLEVAIAITLVRFVGEPSQAMAQTPKDQFVRHLIADYNSSSTTGSPTGGGANTIRYNPPPPATSSPSGVPGGIRGLCNAKSPKVDQSELRALVPERDALDQFGKPVKTAWGQTISDHPTFWFDVPYSSDDDLPVEFVLQDRSGNDIYRTKVTLPKTPGIIRIQVPATQPSLQPQQSYLWTFQVNCKGADTRDKNDVVRGWIVRTTLDPILMQKIKAAELRKQAALYAEHGIWFDALTTLGNALKAKPKDADLVMKDWVMLLNSAGLQATTSRSIVKQ